MADEYEGRTVTSKDGKTRVVWRSGEWVKDTTYAPPVEKVKPTNADMKLLGELSAKAQAERDGRRTYAAAGKAADDFGPSGTGPLTAWYLDAITPSRKEEGFFGSITDTVGAAAGVFLRPFVSQKTWRARDLLETVNAKTSLATAAQQKGAASNSDMSLIRSAGVDQYKTAAENRRILNEAEYQSGLEETRALATSDWISKYGSTAARSANNMSYEENLKYAEKRYGQHYRSLMAGKGRLPRSLPKAPPSVRRSAARTYDMDGNLID